MNDGKLAAAEGRFREAIALNPAHAEAHADLGLTLERQENSLNEAEYHMRQSIKLQPRRTEFHLNLGALLIRQRRFTEAEPVCKQALMVAPSSVLAWSNLGVLMTCLNHVGEAEQAYRTALAISPNYRTGAYNLAYLLLKRGHYEEGWACLEARDMYEPLERQLQCPRWRGESLIGKSLLIGLEMGHGDMIQFCRYAELAKGAGATKISVVCHDGLARLFKGLRGVDEVIPASSCFPASGWDYWTPPMSFPYLFQTRADTIPAAIPYLTVEPSLIEAHRHLIRPTSRKKVAIVWRGNPRFENDAARSIHSLEVFATLSTLKNVDFYSLQKGPSKQIEEEIQQYLPITLLSYATVDFADTAAILSHVDLLITVDTGIAHLAGALGIPCWVMLPAFKTDWRWLEKCTTSPWYPMGMRLFRQSRDGDWAGVIHEIYRELHIFSGEDGTRS